MDTYACNTVYTLPPTLDPLKNSNSKEKKRKMTYSHHPQTKSRAKILLVNK